jgi:small subunit ribosomal protein S24e
LEINITKDWDNTLLDRKEITFNISHTGATPSRDEIKNKLVAQLNSRHELVIVDIIRTEYGTQNTTGYAKIYSDVDRANEIENKYVLKRNEPKPVEETEKPAEEESGESSGESTEEEAVTEESVAEEESGTSSEESTEEEAVTEEPVAAEESGKSSEESTEEEAVTEEPVAEEESGKSSEESTEEEAVTEKPVAEEEPAK